ncbi:IS701 family transposase [Streptacidiphilus sp. MAP5-3]|uniref:IS701 family transposase n=1 Tax=unclassified Streptacidiphilus TaxID=2643834 RepID=UPI0035187D6E
MTAGVRRPRFGRPLQGEADAELYEALLAPLRRRGQRIYAMQYLRGLLTTNGRKTIRRIASSAEDGATSHALHHFISDSPWDWGQVRRSVARQLDEEVRPRAWVVAPLVIPKSGPHSVGVDSMFVPHLGAQTTGQRSYGVWLAREEASYPVNWRLHLPDHWLQDARRREAGIPAHVGSSSLGSCVARAVLDTASWGLERRPVVIDAREANPLDVVGELTAADVPFLLKVRCSTHVLTGQALAAAEAGSGGGSGSRSATVLHLAAGLHAGRHHVAWKSPQTRSVTSSLASATPVRLAGAADGPGLVLLCEWRGSRGRPSGFWLSSMVGQSPDQLLRLSKLALQVASDTADTGTDVGLYDYEGRTYRGWHHHMTLASTAHAAVMLAADAEHHESEELAGDLRHSA